MENNEFEQLLRSTIAKRCESPMREDLAERVIEKYNRRKHRLIRFLMPIAAAAAVAIIVVISGMPHSADSSYGDEPQDAAPAFFVEAVQQTELRLKESSETSARLRKEIEESSIIFPQ